MHVILLPRKVEASAIFDLHLLKRRPSWKEILNMIDAVRVCLFLELAEYIATVLE
jgi:hypothetical protein